MFNTTIVYENGTCPGYVCFMDFGGSKLRHIFGLNLTSLRNGMRFIQEALPIRLRVSVKLGQEIFFGIHFSLRWL